MVGASQLRLFEPSLRDSAETTAASWLSYSVDNRFIYRHVRRRSGALATSRVVAATNSGDLAADFELSWLRSAARPHNEATDRSLRVADLFSGLGGMSIGISEACRALNLSCEVAYGAELDPSKGEVYASNLAPREMEVRPVEEAMDGDLGAPPSPSERSLIERVGRVDFLMGGPPCQGHSDLNNHTRRDDIRNGLISRMARFAELFKPKYVVIENVQGVRHDRQRAASHTAAYLRTLGYDVAELLVPFHRIGVPQSRRRYMLVATTENLDGIREFEALDRGSRTVGWAIADLLDCQSKDTFNTSAKHSPENDRRIRYLFEHDLLDLPDRERPACHRLKDHAYKAVYGRMRWDQPAPTITTGFGSTGQGRYVHPLRPRTLTPHEAARLQTIPDFVGFGQAGRTQLQKMIGNSVPPLVMTMLGLSLLR
jgi:DNA (cytosine-5)-methyltransferase 1